MLFLFHHHYEICHSISLSVCQCVSGCGSHNVATSWDCLQHKIYGHWDCLNWKCMPPSPPCLNKVKNGIGLIGSRFWTVVAILPSNKNAGRSRSSEESAGQKSNHLKKLFHMSDHRKKVSVRRAIISPPNCFRWLIIGREGEAVKK